MIGLDTNVLLRAIVNDDAIQSSQARSLLSGLTKPGEAAVSVVTLVELAWTLRARYRYRGDEICEIVEQLLRSRTYHVSERDAVNAALVSCREEGLDFADALVGRLNRAAGCATTVTFDGKASMSTLFSPVP